MSRPGAECWSVVPSPTWPLLLLPQQRGPPPWRRAQGWRRRPAQALSPGRGAAGRVGRLAGRFARAGGGGLAVGGPAPQPAVPVAAPATPAAGGGEREGVQRPRREGLHPAEHVSVRWPGVAVHGAVAQLA